MIRELLQAAVDWYRRDRIRISPTEGRLVRLVVGDRILLRGEVYDIIDRQCDHGTERATIEYRLVPMSNANEQAVLRASLVGPELRCISARFVASNANFDVFEDDIV